VDTQHNIIYRVKS